MMTAAEMDMLRLKASQVHPVDVMFKVLNGVLNALIAIPWALGFTVGAIWRLVVFIVLCVRLGYWKGADIETKPKDAPAPPQ